MNISSYNITDVGYHYIGLRALAGLPATVRREEQTAAISRSVQKYASDKALRLMLPAPRGTFESIGERVCQELVHLELALSSAGRYALTGEGTKAYTLLSEHKHAELRRLMVRAHLATYDNLRYVVQRHLEVRAIWRPIVEAAHLKSEAYAQKLLEPVFGEAASGVADEVLQSIQPLSAKRLENALRERVLVQVLPDFKNGEPLFRALCDRLVTLRLLNLMRVTAKECEFVKSYSPCVTESPSQKWYRLLEVSLSSAEVYRIHVCEPDMSDDETQEALLASVDRAFAFLTPQAGYYDLPEVRDWVCDQLRIPEASFDEGINFLLDRQPSSLTVGLRYEGISGRRKPLASNREPKQIFNLIRRA